MNEHLNLVEILKNYPRGTKLYSTIHGEVEFIEIRNNRFANHPIIYKYKNDNGYYHMNSITIDGKFDFSCDGECTLFPSKDQRDWSKFNIEPKFDTNTLKPFDKVLVRSSNDGVWRCDFFSSIGTNCCKFCCVGYSYHQCIPYNEETKHLVGTTNKPPKEYINWEE